MLGFGCTGVLGLRICTFHFPISFAISLLFLCLSPFLCTCMNHFYGRFPGETELFSFPFDSSVPLNHNLNILTGQSKIFHILFHTVSPPRQVVPPCTFCLPLSIRLCRHTPLDPSALPLCSTCPNLPSLPFLSGYLHFHIPLISSRKLSSRKPSRYLESDLHRQNALPSTYLHNTIEWPL